MNTKRISITKTIIFTSVFLLFFWGSSFGKSPARVKIEPKTPSGGTYTCDIIEKICTCNTNEQCEEMAKDGVCGEGRIYCSPEGPCSCYTKTFDPVPLNQTPGKFPTNPYSGREQ